MKKNKKTILIVIAILLLSTLLTISIIFGRDFAKKFNEKTNNQNEIKEESKKEENNEQQENNNEEEPFDFKLKMYKNGNGEIGEHKFDNSTIILEIPVETEEAEIIDYSTTGQYTTGELTYVLYKDKTIKLYDVKNHEVTNVDLENDLISYNLQMSYDRKTAQGIVYSYYLDKENTEKEDNVREAYYNLKTKKKMYEDKYYMLKYIDGDFISGYKNIEINSECLIDYSCYKAHQLLSVHSENVNWSIEDVTFTSFETKKYNNKYLYFLSHDLGPQDRNFYEIYSNSKKRITDGQEGADFTTKDGYLYINNTTNVIKYNFDGKLIAYSKKFEKVIQVIENYIMYLENNEFYITDFENTFKIKLIDWSTSIETESIPAYWDENYGWYSTYNRENLMIGEGIYISKYPVYGGLKNPGKHDIYFNPTTKEVKVQITEEND